MQDMESHTSNLINKLLSSHEIDSVRYYQRRKLRWHRYKLEIRLGGIPKEAADITLALSDSCLRYKPNIR